MLVWQCRRPVKAGPRVDSVGISPSVCFLSELAATTCSDTQMLFSTAGSFTDTIVCLFKRAVLAGSIEVSDVANTSHNDEEQMREQLAPPTASETGLQVALLCLTKALLCRAKFMQIVNVRLSLSRF